jgi:hypothetical protein
MTPRLLARLVPSGLPGTALDARNEIVVLDQGGDAHQEGLAGAAHEARRVPVISAGDLLGGVFCPLEESLCHLLGPQDTDQWNEGRVHQWDVALLAHHRPARQPCCRGRRSAQEETDRGMGMTLRHLLQGYREMSAWQSVILNYKNMRTIR